jgi:hypothetical protein
VDRLGLHEFWKTLLRLRPEISKNKDGTVLPVNDELMEVIERARTVRRPDCPFIFHLKGQTKVILAKPGRHSLQGIQARRFDRS